MGAAETATGLEQPSEQRTGDRERGVGYDVVRLPGETESSGIGLDDDHPVTEAGPEGAGPLRVRFDGDDASPTHDELRGDRAKASTDVDDERVRGEGRVSDELGGAPRCELVPSPLRRRAAHGDGP